MILNRKFGDYVLLQRLAVGGQSEVFLAVKSGPRDFSRPVVIKALPSANRAQPRLVEMFYREAFMSARFSHPNVINVHDARVIEGDHCMLMDFVNGQTVADIAQRGYQQSCPPTLKQIVQIVVDAADGLAYVHDFRALDSTAYSVVHLDVSPQNIMVTYQGVGMIFDFGIARIIGLDEEGPRLAGGKYAYMSPEQLRGEQVDPRSDIFSLGVILYELSTGYRLFRRASPQEVIRAILEEPIAPPRTLRPEMPEALERVIMRALERDPFQRYQSASDLRNELARFLDSGESGSLRRSLGAYVGGMFKHERSEIAMALRAAPALEEARPLRESLTELGKPKSGRDPSPTMELLVPDAVRDAASKALAGTEDFGPGSDAVALRSQLEQMRRRQNVLYALMGAFALIATLLALARFSGAAPAPADAAASPAVVEAQSP